MFLPVAVCVDLVVEEVVVRDCGLYEALVVLPVAVDRFEPAVVLLVLPRSVLLVAVLDLIVDT